MSTPIWQSNPAAGSAGGEQSHRIATRPIAPFVGGMEDPVVKSVTMAAGYACAQLFPDIMREPGAPQWPELVTFRCLLFKLLADRIGIECAVDCESVDELGEVGAAVAIFALSGSPSRRTQFMIDLFVLPFKVVLSSKAPEALATEPTTPKPS